MTPPLSEEQRIVHFLNRTSFGVTPKSLERAKRLGARAYLEEQLTPESIADSGIEAKVGALKTIRMSSAELFEAYPPANVVQERGMAMNPMNAPRVVIFELQQARLLRAVES